MVRRSSAGTRSICITQAAAPEPTRPWGLSISGETLRTWENGGQDHQRDVDWIFSSMDAATTHRSRRPAG